MACSPETDVSAEELWAQAYIARTLSIEENNKKGGQDQAHTNPCEVLIRRWMDARQSTHGLTRIDAGHICTDDCVSNGNIHQIDAVTGLYGCLQSGVYHICSASEISCRNTVLTTEGHYVCTFSGAVLGVKLEKSIYGIPETGMHQFDVDGDPSHEELETQRSLERELAPRERVSKPVASLGPSAVLPDENFVRISGDHETDDDDDGDDDDRIRSRDNKRRRNGTRKGAGKRRQCFSASRFSATKQEVSVVLTDLFYNQPERRRINTKRLKEAQVRTQDALRKFYRRQKRLAVRPSRHEAEIIFRKHMNKRLPLVLLSHDTARLGKYAVLIAGLWHIIVATPYCISNHSRFHIKQHVVGLLYTMQMPFSIAVSRDRQEPLLRADQFLYDNLPHQNDLKEWNACRRRGPHYTKQDVTTGRNNFKKAINSVTDRQERQDMLGRISRLTRGQE